MSYQRPPSQKPQTEKLQPQLLRSPKPQNNFRSCQFLPPIPNTLRPTQGFSLIELLVSMALLGILGGIGVSIFTIVNNSYTRANAISKMQTQGQQTIEVLERSIRSASTVQVLTSGTNNCAADQCLYLNVPTSSIEYQLNGGCAITAYQWLAPNFTQGAQSNGRLQRYYLTQTYGACNGSTPTDLFDSDNRTGISVEQQGSTPVFTKTTGSSGIDSVSLAVFLSQGAANKSTTGPDTRASIQLKSTASLRDY